MTTQTATLDTLAAAIRAAGMTTIDQSGAANTKHRAQNQMDGRTHYFDDSTLRYFFSRVQSAQVVAGGIMHAAITTDALDHRNTERGYRVVIHDFTGYVLARTELDAAYKTRKQADKAREAILATIDPEQVTRDALDRKFKQALRAADKLADALAMLTPERPTLGEMTITPMPTA